jgi:hypothetical protein
MARTVVVVLETSTVVVVVVVVTDVVTVVGIMRVVTSVSCGAVVTVDMCVVIVTGFVLWIVVLITFVRGVTNSLQAEMISASPNERRYEGRIRRQLPSHDDG